MWDVQRDTCTILAIPALQLLIYAGAMHGLDVDSRRFTSDCRELVERLGLLDITLNESHVWGRSGISKEMKSKAQIAWGYFVSASYVVLAR